MNTYKNKKPISFKIEVLISTMNRTDYNFLEKMNLETNALVINQCGKNKFEVLVKNKYIIRAYSTDEKGLSKSRNMAIKHSLADIVIIADDDLQYCYGYSKLVNDAFNNFPDAAAIAFEVPSTNILRPTSIIKPGKVGLIRSMKISSFQIALRKSLILEKNIRFNECFGAGSIYTSGEENIYLANLLRNNLKIFFVSEKLAIVNHVESTWYKGFDNLFFKTKGAMFYEISRKFYFIFIFVFALKKFLVYKKNISFFSSIRQMFLGVSEYKNLISIKNFFNS